VLTLPDPSPDLRFRPSQAWANPEVFTIADQVCGSGKWLDQTFRKSVWLSYIVAFISHGYYLWEATKLVALEFATFSFNMTLIDPPRLV
jgi:hypothetical protein